MARSLKSGWIWIWSSAQILENCHQCVTVLCTEFRETHWSDSKILFICSHTIQCGWKLAFSDTSSDCAWSIKLSLWHKPLGNVHCFDEPDPIPNRPDSVHTVFLVQLNEKICSPYQNRGGGLIHPVAMVKFADNADLDRDTFRTMTWNFVSPWCFETETPISANLDG